MRTGSFIRSYVVAVGVGADCRRCTSHMQNLQDIPDTHNTLQVASAEPFFFSSSKYITTTYFLHVRQATMTSQATMADVNRAAELLIPTILTTIVAFIVTVLRIYVRLRVIKLLDWDDFFNVLAMVSSSILIRFLLKGKKKQTV